MHCALVVGVLLLAQGTITCLHIRDFRVPAHVAEGSEAVLGCKFELQGQRLYAVRWLKDEREFYHFKPGRGAPRHFPVQGVSVDVARSGMSWVTLVFMSRESAGEYACELTGEGPDFRTVIVKKNITVDLLPEGDPQVVGLREYYRVDEPLELNCSSLGARPSSNVAWFVNGEPAPHYHQRGPWHTRSANRLDAIDTTRELSFGVHFSHFIHQVMTIKCRATLPPLYVKEVEYRYQMLTLSRQGKLIETTTEHYALTTEAPCTSTIKIQVEEPSNHFEPWSVTDAPKDSQTPGSAGLARNSAVMLYAVLLCTLAMAFL